MPSLSRTVARLERAHTNRRKKVAKFLRHVKVHDPEHGNGFLEAMEVANIEQATSDEVMFSCPFPGHTHGDQDQSAYMNDGSKDKRLTTVWKCHGCGRSGNAITFYAEHHGISRTKAASWIKEHYDPGYAKPIDGISGEFERRLTEAAKERASSIIELKTIDWKLHRQFEVDWPSFEVGYEDNEDVMYMFKRGFNVQQLLEWRVGYDKITDRIVIPVVDPFGNLVGFKGRAWQRGRKPKYQIIGDKDGKRARYGFEPYEKSVAVFGIDKWGYQKTYVLVEGEIDVMSLWAMNIPALCTGSTYVSDFQIKTILDWCDEVVIWFDRGSPGMRATWGFWSEDGEWKPGVVERMEPFMRVKVVGNHMFDANVYYRRGMHDRARNLVREARISVAAEPLRVVL